MNGTAWAMMAHIITLGIWSAALLVLAGLYATAPDRMLGAAVQQHRIMCRYVFVMVASPAAILAIFTGSVLAVLRGATGEWLLAKLAFVTLLVMYHTYCGKLLDAQGMESQRAQPQRRHPLLIAVPVLLIIAIFVLVLAKPHMVLEYELAPQPARHGDQRGPEQGKIQTTGADGAQRVAQTG